MFYLVLSVMSDVDWGGAPADTDLGGWDWVLKELPVLLRSSFGSISTSFKFSLLTSVLFLLSSDRSSLRTWLSSGS